MSFVHEKISRGIGRSVLKAKKNSPHIFFAVGLGGIIVSTVLACRATLKLEEVVDEIKADIKEIEMMKIESERNGTHYPEQDYYRDLTYVYAKSALRIGKLYGVPVIIGSISIAALTGSHVQLAHRNAALTATLAAVTKAYDEYRLRVREELGEEKERELYHGVMKETVEIDGKKKTITKIEGKSIYARFFEPNNPNWKNDMETNRVYIQCQQSYANHLLQSRGHVFLNDVYDQLGFDRTREGAIVGWVRDGDGDGYIDFDLFDIGNMDFINGNARGCLLDFNVDGVVFDKI